MTSYRRSIATIGLSRTVFVINGDFGRKSQIFPTPVHFAPPLKGFPLNWVSAPGSKNYNDVATGRRKKFDDIFSRVDRVHQRDRWMDRHRATARTALTHNVAR